MAAYDPPSWYVSMCHKFRTSLYCIPLQGFEADM